MKKESKEVNELKENSIPDGFDNFDDVSDISCSGWYKPGVSSVVYASIASSFIKEVTEKDGTSKKITFIKAKLGSGCEAISAKDSDIIIRTINDNGMMVKIVALKTGEYIGIKIRQQCLMLLEYEIGTKFSMESLDKVAIRKGSQSMWNFRIRIDPKAKKKQIAVAVDPVQYDHQDNVPF